MINGSTNHNDKKLDLLINKYRPQSSKGFTCHQEQAARLKEWITEFIGSHKDKAFTSSLSDDELDHPVVATKCVLLTGPPGVGKTSLVYALADELKLHVIESHCSEKRDSKLFTMLKQTNQKGKINPIAKLFQSSLMQQANRRKRRRLVESEEITNQVCNQQVELAVSNDSSIILFDDIDVTFDDDGPFLKSLVEFIQESKRPVILTATKSIEHIRDILNFCEHIHIHKPHLEDCARLLLGICEDEHHHRLTKTSKCRLIASQCNCDIRQCLNKLHFYGENADSIVGQDIDSKLITANFTKLQISETLSSNELNDKNKNILKTYSSGSLVDLLDSRFNLLSQTTLLDYWLNGKPSVRNEQHSFEHDLGEQIKESIMHLTTKLYSDEIMSKKDLFKSEQTFVNEKNSHLDLSNIVNQRIKSRIEPPLDREFYTDIVPSFCQLVKSEAQHRKSQVKTNNVSGAGYRRSRRMLSYLDSIQVYLEQEEFNVIAEKLLDHDTELSINDDSQ